MFVVVASLISYALYFTLCTYDKKGKDDKYDFSNGACDSVDYEIADQMEKKIQFHSKLQKK